MRGKEERNFKIKKSRSVKRIDPFCNLVSYDVLVYTIYRHAYLAQEVTTHLRVKHRDQPPARRAETVRAVQSAASPTAGLYQNQADLAARFRLPSQPGPATPELDGPFLDGLGYKACLYIARQVRCIQERCRTAHGWRNP